MSEKNPITAELKLIGEMLEVGIDNSVRHRRYVTLNYFEGSDAKFFEGKLPLQQVKQWARERNYKSVRVWNGGIYKDYFINE
jgi:hypothetical protein